MARSVGGHIPGDTLAVVPKTGWTDPQVGNLVTWDLAQNMGVDECAANENPIGVVIAMSPAKDVLTVELFTGGMVAVLPYDGTTTKGTKVEATGTLKTGTTEGTILTDDTNGVGKVIAVDRVSGYADVYFG